MPGREGLIAEGLGVGYRARLIVEDVELTFAAGEVAAVVGPNGAGKSTLIKALAGDLVPTRGTLTLDGVPLRARDRRSWRRQVGFMPQDSVPNTGLTVLETVLLGSAEHLSLRVTDHALATAATYLDAFGLLPLAQHRLDTLSGGQRQLVLFAQAMVRRPRVLLLDEPVSALDLRHQIDLMRLIRRETRERKLVTVVVMHDLNLAVSSVDRLIVLQDGRVRASGRPQDILNPGLLRAVYGVTAEIHEAEGKVAWIRVIK